MPDLLKTPVSAQLIELSLLVDLEARWENMRKTPAFEKEVGTVAQDLHGVQKAYAAFRDKLAVYNKRFTPAHTPEMLLNTPTRLARWCRRMREVYLAVEDHPEGRYPAHLLDKAFRWSQRLSTRLQKAGFTRSGTPGTIHDAAEELELVAQWCDALECLAPPA